jgi:hypothetical protein
MGRLAAMPSLSFQEAQPVAAVSPNRADIACFIGFVSRREGPLSASLKEWLHDHGWRPRGSAVADDDPLLHTPVPVESFEAFERLFAWETRPAALGGFAHPTWLGAAVRSFFRQGGARCFVVRAGEPWAYQAVPAGLSAAEEDARKAEMKTRLQTLLPGFGGGDAPSPGAPERWKGLGVLLGLDEAAFVCLPDLPEIVADAALDPAGLAPLPSGPEVFVECSPTVAPEPDDLRQISRAPACTEAGCAEWFGAARHAATFVRTWRREVQLLLSIPLPAQTASADWLKQLAASGTKQGLAGTLDETAGISTAFLQLAFPWLFTSGSEALPGGIEPPDGVLAGVAARSVAARGAYHSLGRQPLRAVQGFEPELSERELERKASKPELGALLDRVSILGPTPTGPRVLSDVTTSLDAAHRPASVGRLTAAILRAARRLGDTLVFEPSGPELWRKIESRLDGLLADFYAAGALLGESRAEAYSVRCDQTTTTPNDLDNGRVLVAVRFAPAHPIGQIMVVLALRDGGVTVAGGAA